MDRCATYQEQMLDYVYDLLDSDDREQMRAHLDVCPQCRKALTDAERQQHMLAAAARSEFPAVRFTPPAPVAEPAPVVLPLSRPRRASPRRWIAAAVLLVGLGLSTAVAWDYTDARRDLRTHQDVLADIDKEREELNERFAELDRKARERYRTREQEILAKHRSVALSGPRTASAGSVGNYQLHLRDGNGKAVDGKLVEAKVIDRARGNKVLYVERDRTIHDGNLKFKLPPNLEALPYSQLALEARVATDGNDGVVSEDFLLTPPTYLAHLATDKPMYLPGETVRFRSLTLERFSLRPAEERLSVRYVVTTPQGQEIPIEQNNVNTLLQEGPASGAAVFGPQNPMLRGIGGGQWDVPVGFDGGEYVLSVREDNNRFPAQQRKFIVNKYQKTRMLKELTFTRRSYGPGDDVEANCVVKTAEGPLARARVETTVQIDGKTYDAEGKVSDKKTIQQTDSQGKVTVRFKLPSSIDKGQASVNVFFKDQGTGESLLKPIPIVLNKLDVEFYPEGGYLVKHVPCRVYFQARTTLGKPAELKGRLMESTGDVAALVQTLADDKEPGANQGMGVFTFTPRPGRTYHLEIDRPAGIAQKVELKTDSLREIAMSVPQSVTMAHEPILVKLHSREKTRNLLVGAYCRGRLFDHARVVVPAGEDVDVRLNPADGMGGVYRVTVFEEETVGVRPRLSPVAERLIFRSPKDRLNLNVALARAKDDTAESRKAGAESSIPGARLGLSFSALGENQQPTPAVLMVSVVDQAILKMADEKTARSMPTHFLLTSEVRKPDELEFADFLLTTHPKATQALDLLLGTQGWRRFAEQRTDEVQERLHEEAQALAALTTTVDVPRVARARAERDEQLSLFTMLDAERRRIVAEQSADRAELRTSINRIENDRKAETTSDAYIAANRRVEKRQVAFRTVGTYWPLPALLLVCGACWLVARGLSLSLREGMPRFVSAVACLGLVACLGVIGSSARVDRIEESPTASDDQWKEGWKQAARIDMHGAVAKWDRLKDAGGALPERELFDESPREGKLPQIDPVVPFPAPPALPGGSGMDNFRPEDDKAPRPVRKPEVGLGGGRGKGGFNKPGDAVLDQAKQQQGGFGGWNEPKPDAKDAPKQDFDDRLKEKVGEGKKNEGKAAEVDLPRRRMMLERLEMYQRDFEQLNAGKPGRNLEREMTSFFVREYAHKADKSKGEDRSRGDTTDVVYWHPALVLPDGKVDVWFQLNDAVTTYQVTAFGHTLDGRLASIKPFTFDARLPLAIDATTPLQVTTSDRILVPVTVSNNTDQDRNVQMSLKELRGLKQTEPQDPKMTGGDRTLSLKARTSGRYLYSLQPSTQQGQASLGIEALAKPFSDRLPRGFEIVPEGFPIVESRSDLLEGGAARHDIVLPADRIRGTMRLKLQAFPSTLADLQQGLDGLLREPHGCFEQASTANYPNVLILSYLKETEQSKPELERKVRALMDNGYQKLTSYECEKSVRTGREGYEWFGGSAPPHEALTAYGLLQFRDMSKHHDVDKVMMDRTRKYLLSRRDGKGGFERNPRALDTFGRAPDHVTNAYIVWALTECGVGDELDRELNALVAEAGKTKDPYFLALTAVGLINRGWTAKALPLLKDIKQKDDGVVDGAATSITGSGGRDLQIETTALSLLAWLKADPGRFAKQIDLASKWLGKQRGGYGAFGSTQSTILALKALIAHAKENRRPRDDGDLNLFVNDKPAGTVRVSRTSSETLMIDVPNAEELLKDGKNTVRVEVTGKNQFPYTLSCTYQARTPNSDPACAVKLTTKLSRTKVQEGDTVRLTARVENLGDKGRGMAVAIVGLPGGMNLPEDFKQLLSYKELPKDGSRPLISTFEVRGRELILYWRDLAPRQVIEVPIDLMCRVPGEYSGPASRAYLYYESDRKNWVEPVKIAIAPRGE